VLGGFHVSHLPEEALNHADAVVIGEGDRIWKEVIKDFQESRLKKMYKDNEPRCCIKMWLNQLHAPIKRLFLPF
jgi:radical SAM superfamily enzyme YgiQ (UPF0313 family)